MIDYTFITDRLAVGNVASRAVPGFVAVVSILATERPGVIADEFYGAPAVPNVRLHRHLPLNYKEQHWLDAARPEQTSVLHIDLADGEGKHLPAACDSPGNQHPPHDLADYLDDATAFISAHIKRGCVLVHCGAGRSRSVSLVEAYLCRYAGMSLAEAAAFVEPKRPGACVAECFKASIKQWLKLDELSTKGPRL